MYPRLFFILCIVGFLLEFLTGAANPVIPLFAQSIGASGAFIGIVVSSYFFFRVFFDLPLGRMSDKIGRRTPIIFGLSLTIITMILSGLVLDKYQLILTRGLWGLGACFFFGPASALIIDIFDLQVRGRALGILVGIEIGGLFFGSLFGGYLALIFNYRMVFLISGLILIPALVLSIISKELKALGSTQRLRSQKEATDDSIKFLKSYRLLYVCFITFFIFFIYQGTILTIFPLYAHNSLNIDVSIIGVLISMAGIGLFFAPFMVGFISKKIAPKNLLWTGISFLIPSMYLLSFARSFEAFLPLMLISGFAKGVVMASAPILAVEATNFRATGASIGAYRTSLDLGNLVGPVVMTMIANSSTLSVFHFAALLALVTVIPILALTTHAFPLIHVKQRLFSKCAIDRHSLE